MPDKSSTPALNEPEVAAATGGNAEATSVGEAPEVGTPVFEIPHSDLFNEVSVLATLITTGLARSHPDARRQFREHGVWVNGERVLSDKAKLRLSDVTPAGVISLSIGDGKKVSLKPV
jgi:tyrosyl-tRNA synthetase